MHMKIWITIEARQTTSSSLIGTGPSGRLNKATQFWNGVNDFWDSCNEYKIDVTLEENTKFQLGISEDWNPPFFIPRYRYVCMYVCTHTKYILVNLSYHSSMIEVNGESWGELILYLFLFYVEWVFCLRFYVPCLGKPEEGIGSLELEF